MTAQGFNVFLDELTNDAQTWDGFAEEMRALLVIAETGCNIPDYVIDGIAYGMGLKGTFDVAHTDFVEHLKSGVDYFASIGPILRQTRINYEAADGYARWLLEQAQ
ncbi:hypothetical protein [Lysinibacter cavernae]|uniref:Uncharacterized protein n=1 Tax=Lysinibacter cavernae TaxID=1640652 RepID=A0A7X5R1Q6_9MICO|nr:hypothetical protein [Lysinibacter cavernae]NIH53986.1 hypothetical protein [Lysinibacter cavernae]